MTARSKTALQVWLICWGVGITLMVIPWYFFSFILWSIMMAIGGLVVGAGTIGMIVFIVFYLQDK